MLAFMLFLSDTHIAYDLFFLPNPPIDYSTISLFQHLHAG
jgi:hypothetical protein